MAEMVNQLKPKVQAAGLKFNVSFDNVNFQKGASLEYMGLQPDEKLPLPRYAPDMHKPIEHVWAQVKHDMQNVLLQPRDTPLTALEAQQLMVQCFQRVDAGGIFRDVCSLAVTYHVIQGDEGASLQGPDGQLHVCTGGYWPSRRYR